MVDAEVISEILEYLKKAGPTNTFRLASVVGMERDQLLNILKRLEEKQAIRFEYGNALFLKFISEEKPKPAEITKTFPAPEKNVKRKPAKPKALQLLQTENKQLQGKLSKLKETIRELEKKASARPKTITRTIIKKVPIIKTVVKTVVKRIPAPHSPLPRKKKEKIKETPKIKKKFKLPCFAFMKNIKKLKEPEFVK